MRTAPLSEAQSPRFGAKLLPPRVPTDLVPRAALLARLEEGLGRKLTLIATPAGYGKTTLLAAWLRETSRPAAYLALDEDDASAVVFLSALVAALQTLTPDFGRTTLMLLRLPEVPPHGYLATTLAAELAGLPQDSVLVLDDYHTLNSADVDELLTALLRHLPPRLHLMLATRQEPALPIAQLRARAELLELRAEDLRFDHQETHAILEQSGHKDLAPALVPRLLERTEGWAAGLRLAVLALTSHDPGAPPTAVLDSAARRYAHAFLIDDVLTAQEPGTQRFLLATAICDRFCAPLCEAVLAGTPEAGSAPALLARLARRNLFLVPLEGGGWYRYHTLFREALQDRLVATASAGMIAALHQRASAWFEGADLVGEALHHALASGDEARAAALVERHAPVILQREEWPQLEAWLTRLPAALLQRRPALLLARGWVHYLRLELTAIPPLLDAATALLDGPAAPVAPGATEGLRGDIDALQSALWMLQDRKKESRDAGWRAWERLPGVYAYRRGVIAAVLALVSHALGEGPQAAARLEASLTDPTVTTAYTATRVRNAIGFVHLANGDLPRLKEAAEQARADAAALGLELSTAWAHYLLGRVHYDWNELAAAEVHFAAVHALRHKCHFLLLRNAMHGLALTQQAQGQPEAAVRTGVTLRAWVAQLRDNRLLASEQAFEARLALLRGDPALAEQWLQAGAPLTPLEGVLAVGDPRLTGVQALLARGTEAAARQAAAEGAALLAEYEAQHEALRIVEVLGVLALAHQARGVSATALDALERALRLAEPAGRVRVFVDQGAPMARLLALYAGRRGTSPYLERLLAACRPLPASTAPPSARRADRPVQLIEPLTRRELEVLQLLQSRRTNEEIAQALYVSVDTVKKHTKNLYQKLQVSGRRHAVAQAVALGVLSPATATERDTPLLGSPGAADQP